MDSKTQPSYSIFTHIQGYFASFYYNGKIDKAKKELDAIEAEGLIIKQEAYNDMFPEKKIDSDQKSKIDATLAKTKTLIESIKSYAPSYYTQEYLDLSVKYQALKYRIWVSNIELASEEQDVKTKQLEKLIAEYKKKKNFHNIDEQKLTKGDEFDIKNLVVRYPEFVDLILDDNNKVMREYFFKFVFIYHIRPEIFVKYPLLASRLLRDYLATRIGTFQDKGLIDKIQLLETEIIDGKQVVTLPLITKDSDGKKKVTRFSILDENKEVFLNENTKTTVKEIFSQFKAKRGCNDTSYELFADGIHAFNVAKFNDVDFTKDDWYKDIPVFKVINKEAAKERFGDLQDGQWGFNICGNAADKGLKFAKSHAYIEIAIPDENGNYRIYGFGEYPKAFPQTVWGKLWFLGNTVPAEVAFDDALYVLDRQIKRKKYPIDKDKGERLMKRLKKDIQSRDSNNLFFQMLQLNCAGWAASVAKEVMPDVDMNDMFDVNVLDAEPDDALFGTLYWVGRVIQNNFPVWLSHFLISLGTMVLLPWRGMWIEEEVLVNEHIDGVNKEGVKKEWKWKSVWNTGYFDKLCILHPFK